MIIAGIDPGVHGAVAVLHPGGEVQFYDPITVAVELAGRTKTGGKRHRSQYMFAANWDMLRGLGIEVMVMEKVVAMPALRGRIAMPASLALAAGEGSGMWQAFAAALGVPCHVVHAATWKAAVMRDQAKTKEGAVALAARLYPRSASSLHGPKGGILDGRAEALLLAHHYLTNPR